MSIIYILIIISVFLAGGFLLAFRYALKQNQYEDIETPAYRILFEDKPIKENSK